MTRVLRYSDSALDGLADIAFSIAFAAGDESVGTGFTDQIRAKCRAFASLPGLLGSPRPELAERLRSFPFKGHVILFRYEDDLVEIVNVLNGRRDLAALYERDDVSEL